MNKKNISLIGGVIALVTTAVAVGGFFIRKRLKAKNIILENIAKEDKESARFEKEHEYLWKNTSERRCKHGRPIIVGKEEVVEYPSTITPETEVEYKTATVNNLKVAFDDLMEIKAANEEILAGNDELRKAIEVLSNTVEKNDDVT